MSKIDLLPCPFCGSKSVHLAENTLEGHFIGYSVHCNGCGVENRYTKHMKKAVNAWNTHASGWISCSERMPEVDEKVLAYYDYTTCGARHQYMMIAILARDGYWTEGCTWHPNESVTHWMPLPNPPKGGKK